MTAPEAIVKALADCGVTESPTGCTPLSGGCIHDVSQVSFGDRSPLVCKRALERGGSAQLKAEKVGLVALAELPGQPLVIPAVVGLSEHAGGAVLILEWIEPGSPGNAAWMGLGRSLAAMHEIEIGSRYGFEADNFIGSTPQVNTWHDDWITFNQSCRFEPQVRWARDSGALPVDDARRLERVIGSLDRVVPSHPRPSLLHGDLWAGNVLPMPGDRMAIVDPACFIGDGWADVAMMQLFGGIPRSCVEAYALARTDDREVDPGRLAVYQLYHLINHLNLFGRGYLAQVMQVADRILGFAERSRIQP